MPVTLPFLKYWEDAIIYQTKNNPELEELDKEILAKIRVFGSNIIEYGRKVDTIYLNVLLLECLEELKSRNHIKLADNIARLIINDELIQEVNLNRAKEIISLKQTLDPEYLNLIDNFAMPEEDKEVLREVIRNAKNLMSFNGAERFANHHVVRLLESMEKVDEGHKFVPEHVFGFLVENNFLKEPTTNTAYNTLREAKNFESYFNSQKLMYGYINDDQQKQLDAFLLYALSIIKYKMIGCEVSVYQNYALIAGILQKSNLKKFVKQIDSYLKRNKFLSNKDLKEVRGL